MKIKENQFPHILTWKGDFGPRKLTIWVVFDVEFESEVQNVQFLHPNPKCWENDPYENSENKSPKIPLKSL